LKKQGELASQWLKGRGFKLEQSPARGNIGEGISKRSEGEIREGYRWMLKSRPTGYICL